MFPDYTNQLFKSWSRIRGFKPRINRIIEKYNKSDVSLFDDSDTLAHMLDVVESTYNGAEHFGINEEHSLRSISEELTNLTKNDQVFSKPLKFAKTFDNDMEFEGIVFWFNENGAKKYTFHPDSFGFKTKDSGSPDLPTSRIMFGLNKLSVPISYTLILDLKKCKDSNNKIKRLETEFKDADSIKKISYGCRRIVFTLPLNRRMTSKKMAMKIDKLAQRLLKVIKEE
jgi:hypothetical protein